VERRKDRMSSAKRVPASLRLDICPITRKSRYTSRASAKRAVKAIVRSALEPKTAGKCIPVVCYECPHCGDWHVGHDRFASG
jgi:hypothetical protein